MADVSRVVVRQLAVLELLRSPEMHRAILLAAQPGVARAKTRAPKKSGAGAASIRAEAVLDGPYWEAHVAWDRDHYYMSFHETGTQYLPARPFLIPSFR